ncbi:MAG: hypothetical protein ACR2MS_06395 [Weeksellaceae bacterium]
MNCYNHPTENAVATCQDCHKGLCTACASLYEFPICSDCNRKRIAIDKRNIIKELVLTLAVGAFMIYFYHVTKPEASRINSTVDSSYLTYLVFGYMGCSIVSGWKTLSAITPNIFLVLPILGWVLFFIIKLFASLFIGPFMLPIRWFRNIMRWRVLKEAEAVA